MEVATLYNCKVTSAKFDKVAICDLCKEEREKERERERKREREREREREVIVGYKWSLIKAISCNRHSVLRQSMDVTLIV